MEYISQKPFDSTLQLTAMNNATPANLSTIDASMADMPTSDNNRQQRVFKMRTLAIKSSQGDFILCNQNGNIALQHNDQIHFANIMLRVEIIKTPQVEAVADKQSLPAPIADADDLWASLDTMMKTQEPLVNQQAIATSSTAPPSVLPSITPIATDPLGFLYSATKHSLSHQNYDSFLSASTATLPYDQVATINSHLPTLANTYASENGLAIKVQSSQMPDTSSQQGNVLKTLAINESAATIIHRSYDAEKTSFAEQSPLDILDELLADNNAHTYHPIVSQQNYMPGGVNRYQKSKSNLLNPFRKAFCRDAR